MKEPVPTAPVDFDPETQVIASSRTRPAEPTATMAPSTRLVCVAGADLGRSFFVGSSSIVIGRGTAEISLSAQDVSRNHARVSPGNDGHFVEDLGSVNGTFVNNVRVVGQLRLQFGDRVQVASTILAFTHHDELEARMQQHQRLEAMSALAGGLAHDFNNALMVILASVDDVSEQVPRSSELCPSLDAIREAAFAASLLAKRLLSLGRTEPTAFDVVPVAALVNDTVAMARQMLGKQIAITINVGSNISVTGSHAELQQMLLNFLINARDAMPDGGRLIINTRIVHFDSINARSRHLVREGDYAELTVTDTGIGMDDATRARIFEPFFTTKGPDKGSGLGLAMIHSIVKRHGGAVLVESVPGHGTTFRTLFPIRAP